MSTQKIERAIISVADKTGIAEFGSELAKLGIDILSTGGTARALTTKNVPVTEVSDYTGFPGLGDLVKTLHPRIHGGILGHRTDDRCEMQKLGMHPIDLVVVNFYDFLAICADPNNDTVEKVLKAGMDIGGPAMVRAAVKNHASVGVVVEPRDYALVLSDLRQFDGCLSDTLRFQLARKAVFKTGQYDLAIAEWLLLNEHALPSNESGMQA